MVARKGARGSQQDPKIAAKRIIYATDTSGTMPSNRTRKTASTLVSLDDFPTNETYDIEDDLEPTVPSQESSGFTAWKWIVDHWEVPTSVLGVAAIILIFATKLDAKVEVLAGDVKEVKSTVEKLTTESTRTSTEVGQLQRAVNRLEDQKRFKN